MLGNDLPMTSNAQAAGRETYIQLAHVLKVLVKRLDKGVDKLQHRKLIVAAVNANYEEKRRVAAVDALVVLVLNKGALALGSRETLANNLALERALLLDRECLVVLSEASLPLFVHHD